MTGNRWQDLGKPTAGRKSSDQPRSKAELYSEARRKGVPGRSTMTKAELVRALERR
jgi:hypothetical protein